MKCPKCGIHYDDTEKECPMCGARKPMFQTETSRPAKPLGQKAQSFQSAQSNRTQRQTKSQNPISTTLETVQNLAGNQRRTNTEKPPRKKRGVRVILLIVVLFMVLPMTIAFVSDIIESTRSEFIVEEEIPFPYAGIWTNASQLNMIIEPQDPEDYPHQYHIDIPTYSENGKYSNWSVGEDESFYWEELSPDEYNGWILYVNPDPEQSGTMDMIPNNTMNREAWDEYMQSGATIVIYQSINDPQEIYFYDIFESIPWLPDNEIVRMEQTDDESSANLYFDIVENGEFLPM